ncbi:putative vacuolar amino acid transporter 1-like [Sesbania bispinosa]|nr:putative vacuolar amino acid transporter 1-like [Sesbania bispinosa]
MVCNNKNSGHKENEKDLEFLVNEDVYEGDQQDIEVVKYESESSSEGMELMMREITLSLSLLSNGNNKQ